MRYTILRRGGRNSLNKLNQNLSLGRKTVIIRVRIFKKLLSDRDVAQLVECLASMH